jgi:hypothetical protein
MDDSSEPNVQNLKRLAGSIVSENDAALDDLCAHLVN